MQYYKPELPQCFVGDCMPFFHDGVYHLFYLLDENHHSGKGGRGGHMWAHASTSDLVQWAHHPLAIELGADGEIDDASICTGSIFHHDGTYYAFYAARTTAREGERVCMATSRDGVTFRKHPQRPLVAPSSRYSARSFRDPAVFRGPDGLFHMLVTSSLQKPGLGDHAGCLAHYTSSDLLHWQERAPFVEGLFGRSDSWEAPECPDYSEWNGRYYLLYGDCSSGLTRYLLADDWNGPWRSPQVDSFDSAMLAVMKTAAFSGNRRIGAAFIRSRKGPSDDSNLTYAGNAIFRELVQHGDGSLGTCWPVEMVPPAGRSIPLQLRSLRLDADKPRASVEGLATDLLLRMHVAPEPATGIFGIELRGTSDRQVGYRLRIDVPRQEVTLGRADDGPDHARLSGTLGCVMGLDRPWRLEIILKGDLIDVCIDRRRTLCLRFPELRGSRLGWFWEAGGAVRFDRSDAMSI
jgi:beta-fructofuranosidase